MPPSNRKYRPVPATGLNTTFMTPEQKATAEHQQKMKMPIAELKLSVRIINTLEEHDVILVEDLLQQTHETLMYMKNFGEKTLKEVRAAVTSIGLPVPPTWARPPKPKRPPRTRFKPQNEGGGFSVW